MLFPVIFYLFAIVAVLAGFAVVTRRNPISAAIALVVCFFFLSGMYAMLDAHFVAVIQILVYAGAIMVLFIFVIMLLNLRGGSNELPNISPRAIAGLGVVGVVGMGLMVAIEAVVHTELAPGVGVGTIQDVGMALFDGKYLIPFEYASALLTVGMVGAVVLGKRKI